jgi:glycosyltransferase involved in cell wall biosynthesis
LAAAALACCDGGPGRSGPLIGAALRVPQSGRLRPIRVLHLRDTSEIGGPGKTILETHRTIDAARFELHLGVFLTRHESGDTPFVAAARAMDMPVHFLRGFNQYDPSLAWQVVQLVRTLDIDILHAHETKSDVIAYLAARLHHVPVMTTLHGWIGNSPKQRLLIGLDRRVVRRFDRAIAVSGQMRDDLLASGMPPDRLRLLHNAIVVDQYRRTGTRGALASLVGRELPRPVVCSIGRLSPEKGHGDLVEALALVAAGGHTMSLVLAGDGSERPNLVAQIRRLGLDDRIHLTGYVSTPQRILEESDLMVLPSRAEGLPNAALEALAMEVPVLATRVGGTPEVIVDGQTGRLVEARSPHALANGLLEFLADPDQWRPMARRGRERVESHFSFATRTRRLEAIYTELLTKDNA